MRINVKIKPFSKKEKIVQTGSGFIVYVNQAPVEGRANKALAEILSEYFNVPRSSVRIIAGHKSRNKIVEIIK